MTLEAIVEDQAKIPEGFQDHYKEVDGKFVLDVSGMKTQADFDNYAAALKKRFADASADLSKKSGAGVTRDELMETVEAALKKFGKPTGNPNGKAGDDPGGDVSARLHDLERNIASLKETNEKLQTELDEALGSSRATTIKNALTQAATKAGADPAGVANLVTLTQEKFEVSQGGDVVTKLEAGKGVTPNQAPDDYFASLSRDAGFRMFWPKSVGAGADPGAGGSGPANLSGNPWTKAGWNVTNQSKLYQANKAEAEAMMKAAGVKLGATSPVR
jgi:cell division septum initiation protein DivIVA